MDSQANTPFYSDKSFWMVILGIILPIISKKIGIQLSVEEIAGLVTTIIAFVAGNKWKSAAITVAEIRAKASANVMSTIATTEPKTPAENLSEAAK